MPAASQRLEHRPQDQLVGDGTRDVADHDAGVCAPAGQFAPADGVPRGDCQHVRAHLGRRIGQRRGILVGQRCAPRAHRAVRRPNPPDRIPNGHAWSISPSIDFGCLQDARAEGSRQGAAHARSSHQLDLNYLLFFVRFLAFFFFLSETLVTNTLGSPNTGSLSSQRSFCCSFSSRSARVSTLRERIVPERTLQTLVNGHITVTPSAPAKAIFCEPISIWGRWGSTTEKLKDESRSIRHRENFAHAAAEAPCRLPPSSLRFHGSNRVQKVRHALRGRSLGLGRRQRMMALASVRLRVGRYARISRGSCVSWARAALPVRFRERPGKLIGSKSDKRILPSRRCPVAGRLSGGGRLRGPCTTASPSGYRAA